MRKLVTIAVATLLVVLSAGLVVERGRDARVATDLDAALREELDARRRETWPRPPLGAEVAEGFGFTNYRHAVRLAPELDKATARAVEEWYATGKALPAWAREFVSVASPGIEALSRGTRTYALGRRPEPGEGLDPARLNGLGLAAEADAILAVERGESDDGVTRALELLQFGRDLTRGGTAAEQQHGHRLMQRGLRFFEKALGAGVLSPVSRERLGALLSAEISRRRDAHEILSGLSLNWQLAYSRVLSGDGTGAWNRHGTGWGADLPSSVNPQYLSDDDFIDAWSDLRRSMEIAREGFGAGRPPGLVLIHAFGRGANSPNLIHAACSTELHRSLKALFAAERTLRKRMTLLHAALDT